MNLKKFLTVLSLAFFSILFVRAQDAIPTSGDVTVRLSEPVDFATGRPLQAIRSVVISATNPMITPGSPAVLQLQNGDGSYTLKLLRLVVGGQLLRTMSQPGVSVSGGPASGQNASLAGGATVKFTLTRQDGSPGLAVPPAVPRSSPAPVPATMTPVDKPGPTQTGEPKAVASCPAKPGKKLLTVRLQVMPTGQFLDGTGDDSGTEWDQSSLSEVKAGEQVSMQCGYGAPSARPDGAVTAHATVPLPATAKYCWSDNGTKVTGTCYDRK